MMMARRMPNAIGAHLGHSSTARGLTGNLFRRIASHSGIVQSLNPTGLGLSQQISPEVMQTIRALPEVSAVVPDDDASAVASPKLPPAEQISSLKRAEEIFQQFGGGGNDHVDAVRMILADQLCDVGKFDEAATCIGTILENSGGNANAGSSESNEVGDKFFALHLALAKAQFYGGFECTLAAERAVDIAATEVEDANLAALRQGVSMNALALTKLARMDYAGDSSTPAGLADEADECREMLSMATSVLNKPALGERGVDANLAQSMMLAEAASSSNQGVAETLHNNLRAEVMGYDKVPPADHALKCWNDGLNRLEGSGNASSPIAEILRSRFHANIAMALLGTATNASGGKSKISEEDLKIASENASKSLKLLDGIIERSSSDCDCTREALRTLSGRSLRLVADCYARGGSAVIAEGLYQSALDLLDDDKYENSGGPIALLERREVYRSYAALCANWENRSGDSNKLKQKAEQVEGKLTGSWINKSSVYGGLWLFSLSDLSN